MNKPIRSSLRERVSQRLDELLVDTLVAIRAMVARSPVKVIRSSKLAARERNAFSIGRTFGEQTVKPLPPEDVPA